MTVKSFQTAEKIRVLIPTTTGVVEVLRVSKESKSLARSTVRMNFDVGKPAGIDAAYNEFVNSPGGLIERHFGHNRYRTDVSGPIDVGNSWHVGLFIAHALSEANRLAVRNERKVGDTANAIVWATGALLIDQRVARVGEIATKLRLSASLFRGEGADVPMLVVIPREDLEQEDAGQGLRELELGPHAEVLAIDDINTLLSKLGLTRLSAYTAPAKTWAGNPYRGLATFESSDRAIFFGRNEARRLACSTLLENADARHRSFLLVTGRSGSGKSSLVRAGLIGDLRDARAGYWLSTIVKPSGDVISTLARNIANTLNSTECMLSNSFEDILRDAPQKATADLVKIIDGFSAGKNCNLILVVDQLEQLLLLDGEFEQEIEQFSRALKEFAKTERIWIIATLRSDLYHLLEKSPSLVDLVRDTATFLLPRLGRLEIRDVIRQPAVLAGASFEIQDPDNNNAFSLADQIEDDVVRAGDDVNLPLLEFALANLFEKRSAAGVFTHKAYNAMGRLGGAIANHAESTIDELLRACEDRFSFEEALKWVLLDFVRVERRTDGDNSALQYLSRHVALSSAGDRSPGPREAIIDALRDARLVQMETTGGATTARLAHDALIQAWPRLRATVERYVEDLLLRDVIQVQARRWQLRNDTDWLLRGRQLAEASQLSTRWGDGIDTDSKALITASLGEQEKRQRTEARNAQRRTILAVAAALLFAGLGGFAAIGWWQASLSDNEARSRLQAAVDANQGVSERVLKLQQDLGLRTGVAGAILSDTERRLSALLNDETSGHSLNGSRAPLVLAIAQTLLNFSDIELEGLGSGAAQAVKNRVAEVQRALRDIADDPRYREPTQLMLARSKYLAASTGFVEANSAHELQSALAAYDEAAKQVPASSIEADFLLGHILEGRGLVRSYLADTSPDSSNSAARAATLQSATADLNDALAKFKKVAAADPGSPLVQREVLAALYHLSDVQDHQTRLKTLEEALDVFRAMPDRVRSAVGVQYERSRVLSSLASSNFCLGHVEAAEQAVADSSSSIAFLVGLDPDNYVWLRDLLAINLLHAKILRVDGNASAAAQVAASTALLRQKYETRFPKLLEPSEIDLAACPTAKE